MDEYPFAGQFYESKSRVGGIAGQKPIDSVFSKSTSGLEIIDPFCDPRDSENHPISSFWLNFKALSKRILWSVLLPEIKSTGNRDRSRGLKIMIWRFIRQRRVADTEVEWIIPPGNSKSRVWHRSKGKATRNSKVERKRAVPNEGPNLKGQASRCPSVKSRGLVSAESCLFSFTLQWTERWEAGLGLKVQSH